MTLGERRQLRELIRHHKRAIVEIQESVRPEIDQHKRRIAEISKEVNYFAMRDREDREEARRWRVRRAKKRTRKCKTKTTG